MISFVDTHCHLNHPAFDTDLAEVRRRAQAAGVSGLLCIGYDLASSRRAAALTRMDPALYAALGIHPESAGEWDEAAREELLEMYRESERLVAYGEIGLDYHWDAVPHDLQQRVFREQIAFAGSLSPTLPLIIHCRDAQDDVLAMLRESATTAPVVMHCFTGNEEAARRILDAGYFLGIGGVATFKKSDALRAAIAAVPLDRILLETDSPYLAPQARRGKRNEPSYLPSVAQTVAEIKNLSLAIIADVTTATASALFGIKPEFNPRVVLA